MGAQFHQAVRAQGVAGFHQVNDQVGQSHHRRQLHGPAQGDDLGRNAAPLEIGACQVGVFGGDTWIRLQAQRSRGALGPTGHHQPAMTERQAQRLVDIAAALSQHILADHAQVGHAILDINRNIAWLGQQEADAAGRARNDQAPGRIIIVRIGGVATVADLRQQGQGLMLHAPFG